MSDPRLSLACDWLRKARSDLESARKLARDPDPFLDTAAYHCQQAAEKAVKGFLVLHDQEFDKVHDVRLHVLQAAEIEPLFKTVLLDAELLTPYATAFRYPYRPLEPTPAEFTAAFEAAERVYKLVLSVAPQLTPAQSSP